ncbi:lipid-A-disaccharide synthase-related protein [Anianabacter salinae]|uniref:lipid-A-disaccharide synthase-related protein n=1 Tax=Anianabacter salinae TaxID=2851023 RepID=UPI00225E010F|nr:lipid-A-disaccharide synthase-related protein [Anianabacter salinae]MBV0912351.1 lipid-A-disaccharide synthase-related protein [Anianabacter salinae]
MTGRLLVASNGYGEDGIACRIIDALQGLRPGLDITAWPMVGFGQTYLDRGIPVEGPTNTLPSEGFGTVSLRAFLRDLRAGFIGTYARQLIHARRLRGRYDLMLGVGDVVPLFAAKAAATPMVYVSCAKSAYYGPATDHDRLDRWLMRQSAVAVFPRDALTAEGLRAHGIDATDAGNPMMDGLEPAARLTDANETGIAMLAGSRRDAALNASDLLAGAGALAARHDRPQTLRFLFAAAAALDAQAIALPGGWRDVDGASPDGRRMIHDSGAKARIVKGRFADVLASCKIAAGMAGTANEQAVGLGLPLVNLPGRGNQGEAFWRMKSRYFGEAALSVPREADAMAKAMQTLLGDAARCEAMARAGRERMGPPGASARIAQDILSRLDAA